MTSIVHSQLVQAAVSQGALQLAPGSTVPYTLSVSLLLKSEAMRLVIGTELKRIFDEYSTMYALAREARPHDKLYSSAYKRLPLEQLGIEATTSKKGLQGKAIILVTDVIGDDPEGVAEILAIEQETGAKVATIFTVFVRETLNSEIPKYAASIPICPILTLESIVRHLPPGDLKKALQGHQAKYPPRREYSVTVHAWK